MCLARLVQEGRLELDVPLARYWPEFGAHGKDAVTVAQAVSHQAGVPVVDGAFSLEAWTDERLERALAAQAPFWPPATAHGYHAITVGVITDALVRRVDGRPLGRFFEEEIARPLGAEFWIGLPAEQEPRVVPLQAPRDTPPEAEPEPDSLIARAFACAPWLLDPTELNRRDAHAVGLPAVNGVGSAEGLARLYAACVGRVDGVRVIEPDVLARFTTTQARGHDLLIGRDSHFGVGFELPMKENPMLGPGSFGHDGRGGMSAFGDVAHGIGVAFLTDAMSAADGVHPVLPPIVAALRGCLDR